MRYPRLGLSILAAPGEVGSDCCSRVAVLSCWDSRCPFHCALVLVAATQGTATLPGCRHHPASPGTAGMALSSWTAACLAP